MIKPNGRRNRYLSLFRRIYIIFRAFPRLSLIRRTSHPQHLCYLKLLLLPNPVSHPNKILIPPRHTPKPLAPTRLRPPFLLARCPCLSHRELPVGIRNKARDFMQCFINLSLLRPCPP